MTLCHILPERRGWYIGSSTIFWVFGMIQPGIEPRSLAPLANTLPTWPMGGISKVGDHNWGRPKGSFFINCYTEMYGEGATPSLGLHHFTLGLYLIMLSVKQVPFYESLVWLDLGLNTGLPRHWWTHYIGPMIHLFISYIYIYIYIYIVLWMRRTRILFFTNFWYVWKLLCWRKWRVVWVTPSFKTKEDGSSRNTEKSCVLGTVRRTGLLRRDTVIAL